MNIIFNTPAVKQREFANKHIRPMLKVLYVFEDKTSIYLYSTEKVKSTESIEIEGKYQKLLAYAQENSTTIGGVFYQEAHQTIAQDFVQAIMQTEAFQTCLQAIKEVQEAQGEPTMLYIYYNKPKKGKRPCILQS